MDDCFCVINHFEVGLMCLQWHQDIKKNNELAEEKGHGELSNTSSLVTNMSKLWLIRIALGCDQRAAVTGKSIASSLREHLWC